MTPETFVRHAIAWADKLVELRAVPGPELDMWCQLLRLDSAYANSQPSSCALLAGRAYLSWVLDLPGDCPLVAPYRVGRAVSDIRDFANSAGALWEAPGGHSPAPGDVVCVLGAAGAHVWIVTASEPGGWYEGIDGGQRDELGHQIVLRKRRRLVAGQKSASHPYAMREVLSADEERGVLWWADLLTLFEAYGPHPSMVRS